MKKALIATAILAAGAGGAQATPAYYDVAVPGGGSGTYTTVWDALQIFANTTTTVYDTNSSGTLNAGDKFLDTGNSNISSFIGPVFPPDTQGLNQAGGYELTVAWTNLAGAITSDLTAVGPDWSNNISYDAGTVFSFYYDTALDQDYGSSVGAADDTGFTNGTKVLELTITGGTGSNTWADALGTEYLQGSSVLDGEVTMALADFWWFDTNNDEIGDGSAGDSEWNSLLGMIVPIQINGFIDQNTDNVETDLSGLGTPGPDGFGNELLKVLSDHDGSVDFVVPEPGTLLLFGIGILGLGASARKARKSC